MLHVLALAGPMVVPARFVVLVRCGTWGSLLQASLYAERMKKMDPENLLSVEVVPTHTDRAMLENARAE